MSEALSRRSFLTGLAAVVTAPAVAALVPTAPQLTWDLAASGPNYVVLIAHHNSMLVYLRDMGWAREEIAKITGINAAHLTAARPSPS